MFHELFTGNEHLLDLPLLALVMFLMAYASIVAWTLWNGNRPAFDHAARMPLADDSGSLHHGTGDPHG